MAIMNKCLCCGLRSGSILSAIYCMIFSAISVALAAYYVYMHGTLGSGANSIFVFNAILILFFISILIFSIILLCAIFRETHKWFIPYIVVMIIYVIIQIVGLILMIVDLVRYGFQGMDVFNVLYNLLCLVINVLCVLCVTSYYQVTRDSYDAPAPAANYA